MAPKITPLTAPVIQDWLVEKIAYRLEVEPATIDVTTIFDDFDLDSTEALILAGELEKWIGMELPTTALWYHPSIAELAEFIAEEMVNHVAVG
ncbi:MAG TPA: acyl carrier protein [Kineosporiaceae bacterium]|nr:acyl carrier protein [Kineosporiaceae bacterium]